MGVVQLAIIQSVLIEIKVLHQSETLEQVIVVDGSSYTRLYTPTFINHRRLDLLIK